MPNISTLGSYSDVAGIGLMFRNKLIAGRLLLGNASAYVGFNAEL